MYAQAGYAMADQTSRPERFVDAGADRGERTYSLINHLVGLLSLVSGGVPISGLICTIIMWRIRAKDSPFLDDHGREAVNFQISQAVYFVIGAAVLPIVILATLGFGAFLVPLGMLALNALNVIGCARGAQAAHRGEYYRYPMCLRFLKDPVDPA